MFKYLFFSSTLFLIGMIGLFLIRRHILTIIMGFELMLVAVNVNFAVFSIYLDDIYGQVLCVLILTVGAAETALGLTILVVYFRFKGNISTDLVSRLKS